MKDWFENGVSGSAQFCSFLPHRHLFILRGNLEWSCHSTFTRTQCTCKHMVENKNISEKKRKSSFSTIPIISRWKSSFSKVLDFINRNLPKSYYSMTMPVVFPVVLGFALNRWESVTSFCLSNTGFLEFIIVISGYLVSFLNSQDLSSSRASYKALCFLW